MAADFLKTHGIDLQDEISKVQSRDTSKSTEVKSHDAHVQCRRIQEVQGVRLAGRDPDVKWDIFIDDDTIASIVAHDSQTAATSTIETGVVDGRNSFLAPSLCHPHVHLDKCFLLFDPKYADLSIEKGDFAEALSLTSQAKARFTHDDLLRRGTWLVWESIATGVTCMRAFVEVDTTVRFKCLDAALTLKERYQDACQIQICAFAQVPIFSGENAVEGRKLMEEALQREGVGVVGSTPYVEASQDLMRENIDWAVEMAVKYSKHLDFHLDYNLDSSKEPMVHYVVDVLHKQQWTGENNKKKITLGHCTRLTLFTRDQWHDLRIRIADLPISFVGLPTSDLFMMGKPSPGEGGGERARGTLQVPQMIQQYGLQGAIGVNNVGNAFTPQGSCDPLSTASMGVGIYQAGTQHDTAILYEIVSTRAKAAIGCKELDEGEMQVGDTADFVLFNTKPDRGGRGRKTLQEIIYDPPSERTVLHKGHMISLETER